MINHTFKTLGIMAFCGAIIFASPCDVRAAENSGPGLRNGNYMVTIDADDIAISKDTDGQEILLSASKDSSFEVIKDMGDGYMKVKINDDTYGYLPVDQNVTVSQTDEEALTELKVNVQKKESVNLRQSVVNYALQFVGGRYRYGGTDPHSGVDCSGFTRYVMQNAAGITINRSSRGQAVQGRAVSADQMQPGDLIFYGSSRHINHVAMYIGNGQVVHASSRRTGIKTSPWNYRAPVKIVNFLGD